MALIGVSHLTWKRHLQAGLQKHRITLKQAYLLRQLTRREALHPAEIAGLLYCDRPTASVIIGNMVRQGWIAKAKDPRDGRQVRIVLTAEGRAKGAALEASPEGRKRPPFDPLACFTEAERKCLAKLLRRLRRHLAALPSPNGEEPRIGANEPE
jgi:DNA-binding MarR family transcriptional regulator